MVAFCRRLLVALAGLAFAAPAGAHPHVWVTMTSELIYAGDGHVTGIRHHWAFDRMFTAFALQGMQGASNGAFTRAQLQPLAKVNVESLKEFKYFTYATADGRKAPFVDPLPDYWLDYRNAALVLNFTLPFKRPVKAKLLKIEVYDPTFFVDFEYAKDSPVHLVGAPASCKLNVMLPPDIAAARAQQLGEAFFNALTAAKNWGAQFANKILVSCP
jgi:ABC-type uncharacterized transport system substrate-binding protein